MFEPVPPPPDMERIDRRELYTSLPARIQFLLSFLEFTHDDVAALVDGQKYIKAIIPDAVDLVYRKLLKYDITARVFTSRDSRNEDPVDRWPSIESVQITNRKMFLRWYLIKLNSDPTKMEYWEYLDKVGKMHIGHVRRDSIFVEYVFLGATLGFIQEAMFEAILSHKQIDLPKKIAIVKALGKVIWIQNDLMERYHNSDGAEFDESASKVGSEESDAEGYLHGKKVLGKELDDGISMRSRSSSSTGKTTNSSGKTSLGRPIEEAKHTNGSAGAEDDDDEDYKGGSRCPFSGMTLQPPGVLDQQRATSTRPPRTPSVERGPKLKRFDQMCPARPLALHPKSSRDGKSVRVPNEVSK